MKRRYFNTLVTFGEDVLWGLSVILLFAGLTWGACYVLAPPEGMRRQIRSPFVIKTTTSDGEEYKSTVAFEGIIDLVPLQDKGEEHKATATFENTPDGETPEEIRASTGLNPPPVPTEK